MHLHLRRETVEAAGGSCLLGHRCHIKPFVIGSVLDFPASSHELKEAAPVGCGLCVNAAL